MQRRIERGFLIVGAELGDVERFIIIGGEDRSTFLNRFAEGIGDFVGHVGVDDHDLAKVSGRKRHRDIVISLLGSPVERQSHDAADAGVGLEHAFGGAPALMR